MDERMMGQGPLPPCPQAGRSEQESWAHGLLPAPRPRSLTFIADETGPALGAVTAIQAQDTGAPIPAVITGQAAVRAEGVIQADWGQIGRGALRTETGRGACPQPRKPHMGKVGCGS